MFHRLVLFLERDGGSKSQGFRGFDPKEVRDEKASDNPVGSLDGLGDDGMGTQ
jgi:hypothetical protein